MSASAQVTVRKRHREPESFSVKDTNCRLDVACGRDAKACRRIRSSNQQSAIFLKLSEKTPRKKEFLRGVYYITVEPKQAAIICRVPDSKIVPTMQAGRNGEINTSHGPVEVQRTEYNRRTASLVANTDM